MKLVRRLTILFQIMVCSCSQMADQGKIPDEYVSVLAEGDFKIPSRRNFDILFVRSNDKRIVETSVDALHSIYRAGFETEFDHYSDFLSESLNGNFEIPREFFDGRQAYPFIPEADVIETFEHSSSDEFAARFCDQDSSGTFTLKDSIPDTSNTYIRTVLYCMFLKGFEIHPVDSKKSFIIKPMI